MQEPCGQLALQTGNVRLHYRFCETSVVPCTGLFLVSKYQKAWAVIKHSIGFYRIFSAQLDRNNRIALWSCCETCFWDMTCLVYKPRSFERIGYCVQTSTLDARATCATRATCQGKRFRRFPRGQGVASSLFSTKAAGFVTPKFASFHVPCGSLRFPTVPCLRNERFQTRDFHCGKYLETSDSMYILTPFMNSGDLLGLMKKCVETDGCRCSKGGIARTCWDKIGGPYSNAYVLTLFYQAVLCVQDMHSKGLVHMDIKLENIMMNCVAGKFLRE